MTTKTEKLVELAKRLGVEDIDLDDLVHEAAADLAVDKMNSAANDEEAEDILAEHEHDASDTNNGGLAAQIAFLVEYGGNAWAREQIELIGAEK